MKTLISFLAFFILFVFSGCSENSIPVSPDSGLSLSKKEVPIKLTVDGISNLNPYTLSVAFEGGSIISHVGKGATLGSLTLVPVVPGSHGNLADGQMIILAANGDEIHSVGIGTYLIDGTDTHYTFDFTISGGTGRFENATGSLFGIGLGQLIEPTNPLVKTVHIDATGVIKY
jgi:hypothetical protein